MNNFFKEISKLYLKNKTKTKTNKNKKTKKTTEKPEALIMVETDSLSFVLSCCSIPFYIIGLIGNVLVIRIVHKTREMHTPTNYLLASMAVSDVFTIVTIAAQSCLHPECLLSRVRSNQSRSLRMCWPTGFNYQSSVEDSLDCI